MVSVGEDRQLSKGAQLLRRAQAAGIETTGSCQGLLLIDRPAESAVLNPFRLARCWAPGNIYGTA